MKISELVQALKEELKEHGDLAVTIRGTRNNDNGADYGQDFDVSTLFVDDHSGELVVHIGMIW